MKGGKPQAIDTSLPAYGDSMYGFFRRTVLQSTLGQIGASLTIVALTWSSAEHRSLLIYICVHYILISISTFCSCSSWTVTRRGEDGVPKFAGVTGVAARIWCGSLCWIALPACQDFSFVASNCFVLAACAAGGIISLGPLKSLARQTLMALLLPFALACFWTGYWVLGSAVIFFLIVVAFRGVQQLHEAYCELILRRAESNSVAVQMEAKNLELIQVNQNLEHEMEQRAESERKRAALQEELIASSRRAGMAEVATGILHNVGNVMNSVNVATGLVQDQLKDNMSRSLKAAAELLEKEEDLVCFFKNDPRAKHLPGFLAQMHKNSLSLGEQLIELREKVEYVNQVVAEQQAFASHADVSELVDMDILLTEVLANHRESLAQTGIQVTLRSEISFTIKTDRHRVSRVLQSLIQNSIESIQLAQPPAPKLILEILEQSEEILLSVVDNGIGIAPSNVKNIFRHGCRTSDGNKRGNYSLHQCACSMEEIGAKLTAKSEGPGSGTSFTVHLPKKSVIEKSAKSRGNEKTVTGEPLSV